MKSHLLISLAGAGLFAALYPNSIWADGPFVTPARPAIPGILEIAGNKQAFLDDLIIFEASHIYKFVARPQKYAGNPILVPDKPWEMGKRGGDQAAPAEESGIEIQGDCAIYDREDQIFKLWYFCATAEHAYWCYATSKDGYHWEKPNLGIYNYRGSTANNILADWDDPIYTNVIKDSHEKDPARRYKAMGEMENGGANTKGGLAYAYSPDGLHWTQYPGNPVIHHGRNMADSPIGFFWDPKRNKYVHYPRPGHPLAPEFYGNGDHRHIRAIGYAESDDCIHWTPTVCMLTPDKDDRGDYQYMEFTSVMDGEFYVGLNSVYEPFEQTWDAVLMSSRDGFHWNWIDRKVPFIGRGEIGTYDAGFQTPSAPILHDGKIWIYYGTFSGAHSYNQTKLGVGKMAIGLCTLPENRWMGLMAGPHHGTLVTRPFIFAGSKLVIDLDAGVPMELPRIPRRYDECELRIAIEDQSGGRIEGYTIDQSPVITHGGPQEITWNGADVAKLAGKPIRLRFEMRNACLYSFQFM